MDGWGHVEKSNRNNNRKKLKTKMDLRLKNILIMNVYETNKCSVIYNYV